MGFQQTLEEFAGHLSQTPEPVIGPLACSLVGSSQTIHFSPGSLVARSMAAARTTEPFNCSAGLNPARRAELESGRVGGCRMLFSGLDEEGQVRLIELPDRRFFIASLFLPQLASRPGQPHPLVTAFITAARAHHLSRTAGS